jgi:hypothetical protein
MELLLNKVAEPFAAKGFIEIYGFQIWHETSGSCATALTFKDVFPWSAEDVPAELLKGDHIVYDRDLFWGQ